MGSRLAYANVVIALNGTVSGEVDLRNHRLIGIRLPSNWTTGTITFQSAGMLDDATPGTAQAFITVANEAGAIVTVASIAASNLVGLKQDVVQQLAAAGRTKLVAGAAQASGPVTIQLVLEPRETI